MQTKKKSTNKFKTITNKELLDELFKRLKEVNCYDIEVTEYINDTFYTVWNMDVENVEFSVEHKDDKLSWR